LLNIQISVTEGSLHIESAVAGDDGQWLRFQRRDRPHYMDDEWLPSRSMQDFGQVGFHPTALAGGQDDGGQAHQCIPGIKTPRDPRSRRGIVSAPPIPSGSGTVRRVFHRLKKMGETRFLLYHKPPWVANACFSVRKDTIVASGEAV
jgi:hypothetical protein